MARGRSRSWGLNGKKGDVTGILNNNFLLWFSTLFKLKWYFFSFLSDTDLFLQSYFVITHLNVGARTFETVPVVSGVVRK